MDFWEVMKVVVRRWVVTVPLLLLAAAVAVLLPPQIDPTYAAATSTAVISPAENAPGSNPFLAIGAVSMAQGIAASSDSPAAVQQIVAAGGSPRYTVAVQNSRSPILNIQVDADTQAQAAETATLVLDLIRTQLTDRQSAAGAPPETQYFTQDLIAEAVAVPVYDGAQRVRFLSIGLGIGLAVAAALLVEGIAVMRARGPRTSGNDVEPLGLEERLLLVEEREKLLLERERLLDRREGGRPAGRRSSIATTTAVPGDSPDMQPGSGGDGASDTEAGGGEDNPFDLAEVVEPSERRQRVAPRR